LRHLDLLLLEHIVLVERDDSGQPTFTRPASQKELEIWAERFTPGELYTMGRLTSAGSLQSQDQPANSFSRQRFCAQNLFHAKVSRSETLA